LFFLVGAFQIYSAKLLKKGLVTTGLYKRLRHPQYTALTLLGIGILLTWDRFVTYLSFFIMLWLYYLLAKNEERQCRERFGDAYREYQSNTFSILPGDQIFSDSRTIATGRSRTVAVILSGLLVASIAIGSGLLIMEMRYAFRCRIPVVEAALTLEDGTSRTVPLLAVKGPALQASPSTRMREQFFGELTEDLLSSSRLAEALGEFDLTEEHTLLAFFTPGSDWHSGFHRDAGTASVDAFILVLRTPVPYIGDNFDQLRKNWQIQKLVQIREVARDRQVDSVSEEKGWSVQGPPWGAIAPPFQRRMEDRVRFFLSGL
jgi:hypothetical protein